VVKECQEWQVSLYLYQSQCDASLPGATDLRAKNITRNQLQSTNERNRNHTDAIMYRIDYPPCHSTADFTSMDVPNKFSASISPFLNSCNPVPDADDDDAEDDQFGRQLETSKSESDMNVFSGQHEPSSSNLENLDHKNFDWKFLENRRQRQPDGFDGFLMV